MVTTGSESRGRRGSGAALSASQRPPWLVDHLYPVVATVALVIVGMASTTWGAHLLGERAWSLPHDLWRTMVAANRLSHLDFANLYTPPTALVTFPGAAFVLMPAAVLADLTGAGLTFQSAQNPFPHAWLIAGPYEIVLSASVLFAADALAARLGAGRPQRALLAAAEAIALWNVSVRWGHPEDAVAMALLLVGVMALADRRPARSAWMVGFAVAVQPLVLLALPVLLVMVPARRLAGFVLRAAVPATALLAVAAIANWTATVRAVTSQPNFPTRNHPTPWTWLAPDLGGGVVAAGPARVLAILTACGCAVMVARRWRSSAAGRVWTPAALGAVLWWIAVSMGFRCFFEPVMVAYYLWPVLAVALVVAAGSRTRLPATSVVAIVLTFASQASWRGPWVWWGTMVVVGLGLMLVLARPRVVGSARPAAVGDELFEREGAGNEFQ